VVEESQLPPFPRSSPLSAQSLETLYGCTAASEEVDVPGITPGI
jgi:hypothetical protein